MMAHQRQRDIHLPIRPSATPLPFPQLSKPEAEGFFSVDTCREFEGSARNLRYFKDPKPNCLPFDLNIGLSTAIKKPIGAADEGLDHLLKYIYDHHIKILVHKPPPEFVAWRGLLRLLMCTPYEYNKDWCIHVTRFNDITYMVKRDTDQEKFEKLYESEDQKKACAYGFKFEQYCLSESPFKDPDPNLPVNECEEFGVVYRTSLAGIALLYGAEMDGVMSEQPLMLNYRNPVLDNVKFVELKTRLEPLNQRQQNSYLRYKSCNWWCQSYLVGISDLYVGLRNANGVVQAVKRIDVSSLPKNGAEIFWNPSTCFNFLKQFLAHLKSLTANHNCPYSVYEIHFHAKSSRLTYEFLEGKTDKSFLPDWYINLIHRLNVQNVN